MTNLDPQTTADFWDEYITAADASAPKRRFIAPSNFRTKAGQSSMFWCRSEEMQHLVRWPDLRIVVVSFMGRTVSPHFVANLSRRSAASPSKGSAEGTDDQLAFPKR
jgi:hypothetical protein